MTTLKCTVTDITLLSEKEYNEYKHMIPSISSPWWLKTLSDKYGFAKTVYSDSSVYADTVTSDLVGVRPVIQINLFSGEVPFWFIPKKLVGKSFTFSAIKWIVLTAQSGTILAICDKAITSRPFSSEYCDWEYSALKGYLDDKKYDLSGSAVFDDNIGES